MADEADEPLKLTIVKPVRIIGKITAYNNALFTSGVVAMTPVRADGSRHEAHSFRDPAPSLGGYVYSTGVVTSRDGWVAATLIDVIVRAKDPAEEDVPTVIFPAKDAETAG